MPNSTVIYNHLNVLYVCTKVHISGAAMLSTTGFDANLLSSVVLCLEVGILLIYTLFRSGWVVGEWVHSLMTKNKWALSEYPHIPCTKPLNMLPPEWKSHVL